MFPSSSFMELFRWGFVHLPGAIFYYSKELELDTEDIGLLATLFYAFENIKPLFQSGVSAGQVMKCCPAYTSNRLSKRLSVLEKKNLISLSEGSGKSFVDRHIHLEPMMDRLEQLIMRDHPGLAPSYSTAAENGGSRRRNGAEAAESYGQRIELLENNLFSMADSRESDSPALNLDNGVNDEAYRKVADFISKKTGNLISLKMGAEVKKWLVQMGFTPDFLLIMLELCFERKINNPIEITRIASDLHKYAVSSVEGLNLYFQNYIDTEKDFMARHRQLDPEVIDFGHFVGVDMNAEARKRLYYKWRFEWKMDREVILKAGELMCQRTSNGGLEYVDHVLLDWMNKGLKTVPEVEAEIAAFKKSRKEKPRSEEKGAAPARSSAAVKRDDEYSVYVPPELLAGLKNGPGAK